MGSSHVLSTSITLKSSLCNFHGFCQGFHSTSTMFWASALGHSLIWTFGKMFSINLLGPELQYVASTSERFCFYPWPHISQAHHPPIHFSFSSLWLLITPQYSYWKKNWITPSQKRSLFIMQKRAKRCISVLPQNIKLLQVPKITESDTVPKFYALFLLHLQVCV